MIKKTLFALTVGVSILLFTGCTARTPSIDSGTGSIESTERKQGDTTKQGIVNQIGEAFYLEVAGQQNEIDSYSVDLSQYVGEHVTVTGQYSGDTLFVGEISVDR